MYHRCNLKAELGSSHMCNPISVFIPHWVFDGLPVNLSHCLNLVSIKYDDLSGSVVGFLLLLGSWLSRLPRLPCRTEHHLQPKLILNMFFNIFDLFWKAEFTIPGGCGFFYARDKTVRERPLIRRTAFSIRPLPGFSQGGTC